MRTAVRSASNDERRGPVISRLSPNDEPCPCPVHSVATSDAPVHLYAVCSLLDIRRFWRNRRRSRLVIPGRAEPRWGDPSVASSVLPSPLARASLLNSRTAYEVHDAVSSSTAAKCILHMMRGSAHDSQTSPRRISLCRADFKLCLR